MPLNRRKRYFLLRWRTWREQGRPSFWGIIGKRLIIFSVYWGLIFCIGWFVQSDWIMGIALGALLSHVANEGVAADIFIRRTWRWINDIVDWQRVDNLLAQDSRQQHDS